MEYMVNLDLKAIIRKSDRLVFNRPPLASPSSGLAVGIRKPVRPTGKF